MYESQKVKDIGFANIKELCICFICNYVSDIDECFLGNHTCDENADCANIAGSYNCTCKTGYDGDGSRCEGKSNYILILGFCSCDCKTAKPDKSLSKDGLNIPLRL